MRAGAKPAFFMAKPRTKLPNRSVAIYCQKCRFHLYDYRKGGKGSLVKSFKSRITKDNTESLGVCPQCQTVIGRDAMVRGERAIKFVGGKVFHK